jgi:hypothetical protein
MGKLPSSQRQISAARTGKISDVFNFLKKKEGPALSIGKISKIASRGWARKQ